MFKSPKIIALALLISIFFSLLPISLDGVKQARAIPVIDAGNIAQNVIQAVTAVAGYAQTILEYVEKYAGGALRKRLLDMFVDQIIDWIQGGGKPKFVDDWGGFLNEAAQGAFSDFVDEIDAAFLCQPFNFQIKEALLPIPQFTKRVNCTLDRVVANIENFYQNFASGGWIAYTTSLEPQNNYFGSGLMIAAEKLDRMTNAQISSYSEAVSASGFLSTRKCDEDPANPRGKDLDGDGVKGDISGTCTITTPGDLIGEATKQTLVDIPYLLSADEMSEYLGAIANAVINRLIIEGVRGLKGVSTGKKPPGGVIPPRVTGDCAGLTGVTLKACEDYQAAQNNTLSGSKAGLERQVGLIFDPRQEAQTLLDSSLKTLNDYEAELTKLADDFSKKTTATCPARDANIAAIRGELQWAADTKAVLSADKSKNQSILDGLNKFKDDLSRVKNAKEIGPISADLQKSGLLDSGAANKFKTDTEDKINNLGVNNRSSQNLARFRQELALCP